MQQLPTATGSLRPSATFLAAVLLFVCLPLIALGQFNAHARTDEADPYLFACYGRELLQGAVLYRDAWDIKPPGIFWINALGVWLGRGTLFGVYALCALSVTGCVVLIGWIAYRRYDVATACLAAIMAALYLPLHDLHIGVNRPCTYYLFTDLLAYAAYLRAWRGGTPRAGWVFLAGLIGGLSVTFRQTAVSPMIAVGLHLLLVGRGALGGWGPAVRRCLWLVAGWWATILAAVAAIAIWADPAWAWDAIFAVPFSGIQPPLAQSYRLAQDWIPKYIQPYELPLLLALAVGLHALLRRARFYRLTGPAPHNPPGPPGVVGLWAVWFAAALALALFGIPGRPWYLAPTVPPLLLLSAHAVYLLLEFGRRVPAARPAFPLVVAVVWFVAMMIPPLASQRDMALRQYHFRFRDYGEPTTDLLIANIEAHTQPGDRVFLSAYRPEIYWRTGRRMACRYLGTISAGGWQNPRNPVMPRIAEELRRTAPPLIEWQWSPRDGEAAADFQHWLEAHYRPLDPAGVAGLWLRNDLP